MRGVTGVGSLPDQGLGPTSLGGRYMAGELGFPYMVYLSCDRGWGHIKGSAGD
jgi:hypothetical protein